MAIKTVVWAKVYEVTSGTINRVMKARGNDGIHARNKDKIKQVDGNLRSLPSKVAIPDLGCQHGSSINDSGKDHKAQTKHNRMTRKYQIYSWEEDTINSFTSACRWFERKQCLLETLPEASCLTFWRKLGACGGVNGRIQRLQREASRGRIGKRGGDHTNGAKKKNDTTNWDNLSLTEEIVRVDHQQAPSYHQTFRVQKYQDRSRYKSERDVNGRESTSHSDTHNPIWKIIESN